MVPLRGYGYVRKLVNGFSFRVWEYEMVNIMCETKGLTCNALEREIGYYHFSKRFVIAFRHCFAKVLFPYSIKVLVRENDMVFGLDINALKQLCRRLQTLLQVAQLECNFQS